MQKYYAIGSFVSDSDEKQKFLDGNFLAIGWNKVGDLTKYKDIDEIAEAVKNEYPKDKTAGKNAFKNFINLKEGDKICLKSKTLKRTGEVSTTIYAVGELKKGYPEGYTYEEGYGHKIAIDWKVLNPELKIDGVALSKTLDKINHDDIQKEIDNCLGEGIYELFEKYYKDNVKQYMRTNEYKEQIEARKLFLNDYPLNDFLDIELEDYVVGSGSKDTLCYGFEFGKYKSLGPWIGGGSAGKYGIYYSKEKNTYVDRHGHEIKDYQKTRESLKRIIVDLINDVKNAKSCDDFDVSVEELKSMQMPLTKLLNAYCPEKIIGVAAGSFIRNLANVFHIHYDNNISSIKLNYIIAESLFNHLPYLKDSEPEALSHMIWTFPERLEGKENVSEKKEKKEETSDSELKYTKYDFLDEVFMSEAQYDEIADTLIRKKNIILMGAPGVGKTFCAKKLMYSIMGERVKDRIITVQFHQSYSYEDFIQGYRPNKEGKFELKKGAFYNIVKDARDEFENALENGIEPKKYCIIIDEINRGNLSKVFGELMMLIEADKRKKEWGVKLTYASEGDDEFYIPANLYIIGTMNTADRSLTMVDYALRRRFAFIELSPAFSNQESLTKFKKWMINHEYVDENFVNALIEKYSRLNKNIEASLGKGFCIGHSYFIGQNLSNNPEEIYSDIVNFEIKPLLEEYFYDDKNSVEESLGIIESI